MITRRIPKTNTETSESNPATRMLDTGKITLGHWILLRIEVLETRLCPPMESDVEKNVHGMRPRYENNTYGVPFVSNFATLCKNRVKTSMRARGVMIAHETPSEVCL